MRFLATLLFCSFVLPAKAELAWQASMETAIGIPRKTNAKRGAVDTYAMTAARAGCHSGLGSRRPVWRRGGG